MEERIRKMKEKPKKKNQLPFPLIAIKCSHFFLFIMYYGLKNENR
jgi:hypothetical protein